MKPHKLFKDTKMVLEGVSLMDTPTSELKMVPKTTMMMEKAMMEQVLQEDTLKMELVSRFLGKR